MELGPAILTTLFLGCVMVWPIAVQGRQSVPQLIFVSDETAGLIYESRAENLDFQPLPIPNLQKPTVVKYNPDDDLVFWIDAELRTVNRAYRNGSDPTILRSGYDFTDIGIAPAFKQIGWITQQQNVGLMDYDTLELRFSLLYPSQALAITLSPSRDIYYTEKPEIMWIGATFGISVPATQLGIDLPTSIKFDRHGCHLYIIDAQTQTIESTDLTWGDHKVHLEPGLTKPVKVEWYRGSPVWTDERHRGIGLFTQKRGVSFAVNNIQKFKKPVGIFISPGEVYSRSAGEECLLDEFPCNESLCIPISWMCDGLRDCSHNEDEINCLHEEVESLLIVADSNASAIYMATTNDFTLYQVPLAEVQTPVAVDFDSEEGFIYWSDTSLNAIYAAQIYGGNRRDIVTGLGAPHGIFVDANSRTLYWTDRILNTIEAIQLNGTNRRIIISYVKEPMGITQLSSNRNIYWTAIGNVPKIESASALGGNRITIVDTDLTYPNGITSDVAGNRLFWCDAIDGKIESCDADGGDRKVLLGATDGVINPFDIVWHRGDLMWTDRGYQGIGVSEEEEGKWPPNYAVVNKFVNPSGFHVNDGFDPCKYPNNCTGLQLCVSRGLYYSCVCPAGYVFNELCENIDECANSTVHLCHQHAACIDTPGSYLCRCAKGFQGNGSHCENLDPCQYANNCSGIAQCIRDGGGYSCVCPDGYTPDGFGSCENIDECVNSFPNPCHQNATCTDTLGSYTCSCDAGFQGTGWHCEEIAKCICLNGGTCDGVSTNRCLCPDGYEGDNCQDAVSLCVSHLCQNGGTCLQSNGSVVCACATGFSGNFCHDDVQVQAFPVTLVASTVAGAIALIMIILLSLCYRKYQRKEQNSEKELLEFGVNTRNREVHAYIHSPRQPLTPAIPDLKMSSKRKNQGIEFPQSRLNIMSKLGSGSFAEVFMAEAMGISMAETKTTVAVKMLKETATDNDKSDFIKELRLYMYLDPHPNIVNVLGCCTQTNPWYIIMEYLSNGNLHAHLRKIRTGQHTAAETESGKIFESIPTNELLTYGVQVARAMEYLASKGCIHRDLAARNILLGEDMVCKVADFGLARDLEDRQEYEMQSKGRVPFRWMAPESLLHNTYTTKSDVWSFGILLWEMITLGALPYPGMSSKQVVREISNGYRLQQPDHCSDNIYQILDKCWKHDSADRPSFNKIVTTLEDMLEDATGYLHLTEFKYDEYLYLEPDKNTQDSAEEDQSNKL